MADPLHLPNRPGPVDDPPFPMIGVIAPLLVSVVLFAITRTPQLLLFALFTPVLALAAVVDGRRAVGRRRRRDVLVYEQQLDSVERELDARIDRRALAVRASHPNSARLAANASEWASHPPASRLVLGHADLPAEPLLGAGAAVDGTPGRADAMVRRGRVAVDAPVTVPAATTVALRGEPILVQAMSRALAVQRARAGGRLSAPVVRNSADLVIDVVGPRTARVVGAAAHLAHLDGLRFAPDLLSIADHRSVEQALTGASDHGVDLATLLAAPSSSRGLRAGFLLDGVEPIDIDLVEHGPHAVVGGTTGSGKSALLTAWVLAIAAAHPPSDVVLLLVDCKGGAAFDPLARLPHVVGVVTDLDGDGADRAVRSLAAEMRRRERVLRDAGRSDIGGTDLARLVVVVDEFRVLLESRPDLGAVFVDVAARGRSLGVHLILCTQRPIGSMRGELLANCGLRIALRVHSADESIALVGTDDAARLPATPGSVVLALPGEPPLRCRVARVDGQSISAAVEQIAEQVGERTPTDRQPVVPPWLPPLPRLLPVTALPRPTVPGAIVFGLLDLPHEQRQPAAEWIPRPGSTLIVFGDPRSGRSNVLSVLGSAVPGAVLLGTDAAIAWDRLQQDGSPLLVDDLPGLLAALGERHGHAAIERLVVRLRTAGAAPTVVALPGPSSWGGLPLRQVVGLATETLLLGLSRDDHLACGASAETWSPASIPGGGAFRGARVQVALAERLLEPERDPSPPTVELGTGRWIVVTDAPVRRSGTLAAAGVPLLDLDADGAGVTVTTAEQLQRSWARYQRVRVDAGLVLDRIDHIDARVLTGTVGLLPPVTHEHDVLLVPPEGPIERRRLPVGSGG